MIEQESQKAYEALAALALEKHPELSVPIIESAPSEAAAFLAGVPIAHLTRTLRYLSPDGAVEVLEALPEDAAKKSLEHLEPNRAASLLARTDPETKDRLLSLVESDVASELSQIMTYPPDCAGSMMNPRVTSFRPAATVAEVIERMKTQRHRRVQDVFLVDANGVLVGSVPFGEIFLAESDATLEALVGPASSPVLATASREEVVDALEGRRGSSLPVVDIEGRLVGVLRQEELLNATRRDAAGNALAMVGASRDERALSPFTFAVRKRLPWLQINLLTAFLAASVVGLFEATIAEFTALAILLPVVAGQSGNTGAQALAVTMRGLTLREVRTRQWFRVATKEILAGATNGVAVAVTTAIAVYFWSSSVGLGLVILLSMVCAMTAAGLAGAVIPMILTALRQDPAQSSSIILTTVTDVVGFFSFLGIATLLKSML